MAHCEANSLRRWQTQRGLVYRVAYHENIVNTDSKHYYGNGLVGLCNFPARSETDSKAHPNRENDRYHSSEGEDEATMHRAARTNHGGDVDEDEGEGGKNQTFVLFELCREVTQESSWRT